MQEFFNAGAEYCPRKLDDVLWLMFPKIADVDVITASSESQSYVRVAPL